MNSNNNNIFMAVIGLSACLMAIQQFCNNKRIKEDFGMLPARTWKVSREAAVAPGDVYDIPGNYQASLSPRMFSGDVGAFIRYNPPASDHMAYNQKNPLTYGNMIYSKQNEGFCGSCSGTEGFCTSGCRKGGSGANGSLMNANNLAAPNYSSSNYASQLSNLEYTETTDLLPVQDMSGGQMLNALGETVVQPIIYDRYIYANQKSRLRSEGDYIRGDLPIVPMRNEWFRPSAHPNIDLNSGALMVMGGTDLANNKELLALQNAAAGGLLDVGSGVNYAIQKSSYLSAGGSDIQVSAFP